MGVPRICLSGAVNRGGGSWSAIGADESELRCSTTLNVRSAGRCQCCALRLLTTHSAERVVGYVGRALN